MLNLKIENEKLKRQPFRFSIFNFAFLALVFLGGVALYTATLHTDVQPADSGEFQIAAITLGIPHPPGYPLFTMLGWLFAQVPMGSPFARVSFLSVAASSFTLVLVSATVLQVGEWAGNNYRETKSPLDEETFRDSLSPLHPVLSVLAATVTALALATSTTFWAQATTTNIRSLTAFFTALMLCISARAWVTRAPSCVIGFALAFGFGIGHHVSLIFVGLVLGVFVVWCILPRGVGGGVSQPTLRVLALSLLAFLITQLVWLYLPLRDATNARFAPGTLNTLDGLLFHIFARGFAGDMLAFAAPEFLLDRLALLPTLLHFQFGVPLLALMGLATIVLVVRQRVLGLAWLIAFVLHLFITITYRAPQTVEYALPSWVIACAALGAGMVTLATRDAGRKTWLVRLASCVLVVLAGVFAMGDGLMRWPSYVALAQNHTARDRAEGLLRYAQPGSVILAQWHQVTPMWALQDVEGRQRDISVEYVFPRGAQPYAESFATRAKETSASQITYAASLYERELTAQGLQAFPLSNTPGWRIAPRFNFPTRTYPSARFDNRIVISGLFALKNIVVETGQSLQVDMWWYRVSGRQDGDSITVRILRPDGRLAANADVRLSNDEETLRFYFKRVVLGLPLDLPPGQYDVLVGAYRADASGITQFKSEGGAAFEKAALITVEASKTPPMSQHPISTPANANTPQLIGVDYDTGIPGQVRAWTHWRLGTTTREVALTDGTGQPLVEAKTLPAVVSSEPARYMSLPFDIPPTRELFVDQQRLPAFTDGERYVPFGDQMTLVGSGVAREGAALKCDLMWQAVQPIVDDYIVSVRVEGDGLYKTHDSVPALGAIPTLKWIRGARVLDRHSFDLGNFDKNVSGTVVVYDSVSQLPLLPLDERYVDGVTVKAQ
jgi:hypothetical protein